MMKKTSDKTNNLVILGTGTSTGVPIPACKCEVCQSKHKENKRFRTSALIQTSSGKHIVIDTGPDFRSQVLANKIDHIDAAFITHDHADHSHGIDDLRPFCFGPPSKNIAVYTHEKCASDLTSKFAYIFNRGGQEVLGGGIPQLTLNTLDLNAPLNLYGEEFHFFTNPHGHTETLVVVHGKMAYVVDCEEIREEKLNWLSTLELDLLVIDCLRTQKHQTHLHLEKSLEYAERINAKQTGLIHLTHEFDYFELKELCKKRYQERIFPLKDGQILPYHS